MALNLVLLMRPGRPGRPGRLGLLGLFGVLLGCASWPLCAQDAPSPSFSSAESAALGPAASLRAGASRYALREAFAVRRARGQAATRPASGAKEAIGELPSEGATLLFSERAFDALPLQGEVRRKPWAGHWYPMQHDGTAARPSAERLSPLEKYDRAFRLQTSSASWERKHHGNAGAYPPLAWWGHGHGWASAACLEPEPVRPVSIGGVVFQPEDIKALLSELHFGARSLRHGRRVRAAPGEAGSTPPRREAFERPRDAAERDVNPAVLHLTLCHRIGTLGLPFVVDTEAGGEVRNEPAVAYRILSAEPLALSEALGALGAPSELQAYPYNPAAQSFVLIDLELRTLRARSRAESLAGSAGPGEERIHRLEYVLELDAEGVIVGGEWEQSTRGLHPDFLWVPMGARVAAASGLASPDGVAGAGPIGNPWVLRSDVARLLAASALPGALASLAVEGEPSAAAVSLEATADAPDEGAPNEGAGSAATASTASAASPAAEADLPPAGHSSTAAAPGPGTITAVLTEVQVLEGDAQPTTAQHLYVRWEQRVEAGLATGDALELLEEGPPLGLRPPAVPTPQAATVPLAPSAEHPGAASAPSAPPAPFAPPSAAERFGLPPLPLRAGWLHFLAGDADGALAIYRKLPATGPHAATLLARRSLMRAATGDTLLALIEARQAIGLAPADPWPWIARAWCYELRRDPLDLARARADLRRAARLSRDPLVRFALVQLRSQVRHKK